MINNISKWTGISLTFFFFTPSLIEIDKFASYLYRSLITFKKVVEQVMFTWTYNLNLTSF